MHIRIFSVMILLNFGTKFFFWEKLSVSEQQSTIIKKLLTDMVNPSGVINPLLNGLLFRGLFFWFFRQFLYTLKGNNNTQT